MVFLVCDECFDGGEEKTLGAFGVQMCQSCGKFINTAKQPYHHTTRSPRNPLPRMNADPPPDACELCGTRHSVESLRSNLGGIAYLFIGDEVHWEPSPGYRTQFNLYKLSEV